MTRKTDGRRGSAAKSERWGSASSRSGSSASGRSGGPSRSRCAQFGAGLRDRAFAPRLSPLEDAAALASVKACRSSPSRSPRWRDALWRRNVQRLAVVASDGRLRHPWRSRHRVREEQFAQLSGPDFGDVARSSMRGANGCQNSGRGAQRHASRRPLRVTLIAAVARHTHRGPTLPPTPSAALIAAPSTLSGLPAARRHPWHPRPQTPWGVPVRAFCSAICLLSIAMSSWSPRAHPKHCAGFTQVLAAGRALLRIQREAAWSDGIGLRLLQLGAAPECGEGLVCGGSAGRHPGMSAPLLCLFRPNGADAAHLAKLAERCDIRAAARCIVLRGHSEVSFPPACRANTFLEFPRRGMEGRKAVLARRGRVLRACTRCLVPVCRGRSDPFVGCVC